MSNDSASPYVDINRANFMLGTPDEWTYTMRRDMQEIVPGRVGVGVDYLSYVPL